MPGARKDRCGWGLAWLVSLCACGSTAQNLATSAHANQGKHQPSLPQDALELVVAAPESVVILRVDQLRSSPLFTRFQPYLERATCVEADQWHELVPMTARALVAARSQTEWLAVLDGRYDEVHAQRLLRTASARSRPHAQPGASRDSQVEGFKLSEQGELAVSSLASRFIVLGTDSWVRAALAAIGRPGQSFAATPLWRGRLASTVQCEARTLCALSVAHGTGAQQLQRGLLALGAGALGAQLGAADSALSLSLPEGAELSFSAQLRDAEVARAARRQLDGMVSQLALLTRFTGLPDVLGAMRLSAEDNMLRGELSLSAADLAAYEERAGGLLQRALPGCQP